MKRTLVIHNKAFSVNKTHYKNKRIKTTAFREWTYNIFYELYHCKENQAALKDLRENFDPATQAFTTHIKYIMPEEIAVTKAGYLSSKAMDLTNIEKPLIDIIFLPVHNSYTPPQGCPNINQDDKFIIRQSSEKAISSDGKHRLEVTIEIVSLETILKT